MEYGYLGNSTWKGNEHEYNIWKSMIRRCYCKKHIRYNNYKNTEVCERWKCFEYFLQDIPKIDGFDKDKFNKHLLQLDKDFKQKGKINKIYSVDTCIWLDKKVNNSYQPNHCKAFKMIDENKKEKIYYSQNKCAKENNLQVPLINFCLKGKRKTHKGCQFIYINEPVTTNERVMNRVV